MAESASVPMNKDTETVLSKDLLQEIAAFAKDNPERCLSDDANPAALLPVQNELAAVISEPSLTEEMHLSKVEASAKHSGDCRVR
jgi:hypothetical protein